MSALDTIGKAALHPFLSRDLDDRLSCILIRSVTSPAWNVFALGALVSLVVLFLPLHSHQDVGSTLSTRFLTGYSVAGVVWNALAANAHSAKSGHYGRGLLLFAVWPLSFPYNWREALRVRRRLDPTDAV